MSASRNVQPRPNWPLRSTSTQCKAGDDLDRVYLQVAREVDGVGVLYVGMMTVLPDVSCVSGVYVMSLMGGMVLGAVPPTDRQSENIAGPDTPNSRSQLTTSVGRCASHYGNSSQQSATTKGEATEWRCNWPYKRGNQHEAMYTS